MAFATRSMAASVSIRRFLLLAILIAPSSANHFRGSAAEQDVPSVRPILEELELIVGSERRQALESRVGRLEKALRPTFQAMPKGFDGGLKPDAVRYALHRLFVDRHGWYVKGLEPGGEAWNQTSPAAIFELHADTDSNVQNLFEQRLAAQSFDLHHVAVLAATLESFIHSETVERLHASYELANLSQNEDNAGKEQVDSVVDTYMMLYVLGRNHSDVTRDMVDKYWKVISKVYPNWEATSTWARGVREEVAASVDAGSATSFQTTAKALESIADRYGKWQDDECQDIKNLLMKMEVQGTGRVPIGAFYESSLNGNWQFSESVPYLRQLGVLDESDPQRPSVVIPNYVNSPSNCVASSRYYEVCCINECEALFGHLEQQVAAPESSPARIAELVAALPSATMQTPRQLSAALIGRLERIAADYKGVVPLHSRLFAQWMHHAYPRECPYPHLSGTTKPISTKQYIKETGEKAKADKETMQWYVEEAKQRGEKRNAVAEQADLPWTSEDELFVCRLEPVPRAVSSGLTIFFRSLVMIGLVTSASVVLVQFAISAVNAVFGRHEEKYMV